MPTIRTRRALAVPAALVALAGCGAFGDPGPQTSRQRSLEEVTAVVLHTGGDLTVTAGDEPGLTVTAGEDVIDRLTSEVHDDRLVLDTKGSVGSLGEVGYELVLPAAHAVELSGSGSISAASPSALTGIELSGSGEVRAEGLAVDALTVDLSGSGTITVAGTAARQTLELDGSGTYRAAGLDSTDAVVTIGGSGSADVQVTGTLKAVIEGNGSITYGGGATVEEQIDGSGTVEER